MGVALRERPGIWVKSSTRRLNTFRVFWRYRYMYLMVLPGLIWFTLFQWMPSWGVYIAFTDFNLGEGVWNSPFVGLKHFQDVLANPDLLKLIQNAVIINIYRIVVGMPIPILLALLLNEVRCVAYKRFIQTVTYLPHFITWVIIGGIVYAFCNFQFGLLNTLMIQLGIPKRVWFQEVDLWRGILVGTQIWKEIGWSSILYLAVIATVNPETYEAAVVDGASRFQQIRHLTIPAMVPMIGFQLVFAIASMITSDVTQFFALVGNNSALFDKVDTIDYFIFRSISPVAGVANAAATGGTRFTFGFDYLAAMGIMQAIVGITLFAVGNWAAKRFFRWSGMF